MPDEKKTDHRTIRTTQEQCEVHEAELRLKWVKLKLKLTDWLAGSTEILDISGDYRAISSIINGICGLEKLIGTEAKTPKRAQDQVNTADRVESLLKRLPTAKE